MQAETDNIGIRPRLQYDRIAILVDEFPPAIAGGIATWAWVLSEDLERRG
jgi:hypothetical protein